MCGQQIKSRVDIDGCDFKMGAKPLCGLGAKVTTHVWGEATVLYSQGALPKRVPGDMCHIYTRGKATVWSKGVLLPPEPPEIVFGFTGHHFFQKK